MIRASLHRDAYRLCGDWHEAEDLVQVTLWRIYLRWNLLAEHERLSGYSHRALLRTYLQERRRSRSRFEVLRAQPPDDNSDDLAADERIMLREAIDQLGSRQREVITLRFILDCTVEHAAATLGCTTGTVTSQTHRALARLRGNLTA